MKLVTLIENTTCREEIIPQHGLSLYLETQGYRILFDMGQDAAFARNAEALGIDLKQVDFAILSHGHYDHGGGLAEFLRINLKAPVYVHRSAFEAHFNGKEKYIGLDPAVQQDPRLVFTEGNLELAPGLRLTDCSGLDWTFDTWGLKCRKDGLFTEEEFSHEQYLEIWEGEKRILISGCSHKGIKNIAAHFQPDVLIGGFHLKQQQDPDALKALAAELLTYRTRYYTGHCTGTWQFARLKAVMKDRLAAISAGTCLEIS